eukprot:TRINITY_DN15834_c0_g1_i1.p1 TRINITY_DN15834_c0_g1~~TRINITY_DN15834_c0_g1_i1.p1  ORF type:complete len:224 (-),score=40.79 TRINITY_DN15834_c0_g1_i1:43-672(-)
MSEPSIVVGLKDQVVGAVLENVGTIIGDPSLELKGKAQYTRGVHEYGESRRIYNEKQTSPREKSQSPTQSKSPIDEPSLSVGLIERSFGSIKETVGIITGNEKLETEGIEQNTRGMNECNDFYANRQLETEKKQVDMTYSQLNRSVEEEEHSKIEGVKDIAIGEIKAKLGESSGNQKMEIEGKAQAVHGRNIFESNAPIINEHIIPFSA